MAKRLKPEDLELWRRVAQTAEPMHPGQKPPEPRPRATPPKPGKRPPPEADPLPSFRLGQMAKSDTRVPDLAPSPQERLETMPLRMDRRTHTKLKRGKMAPEARIDLHGMTLDRAHTALNGFILRSHREGRRLVLVITGKGRDRDGDGPIPVRRGVLRHQVPHWLSTPPLSPLILQVTSAHHRHGGGGALYVWLRRNRP